MKSPLSVTRLNGLKVKLRICTNTLIHYPYTLRPLDVHLNLEVSHPQMQFNTFEHAPPPQNTATLLQTLPAHADVQNYSPSLYIQTPPTGALSVMSYYPPSPSDSTHTHTLMHIQLLIFQPLRATTPSISLAPIISLLLIHIPSSGYTTGVPLLDNFQGHL